MSEYVLGSKSVEGHRLLLVVISLAFFHNPGQSEQAGVLPAVGWSLLRPPRENLIQAVPQMTLSSQMLLGYVKLIIKAKTSGKYKRPEFNSQDSQKIWV